jgi:hypothetical protein
MERFGVPNASQNEDVKQQKVATFQGHYGADHYFQTEEFKKQSQETCTVFPM